MELSKRRLAFVELMAANEGRTDSYMVAYGCKSRKVAAVNAIRLLKDDNIREEIERRRKAIEQLATQAAAQELSTKMVGSALEYAERRDILAKIARGQYLMTKIIPVREVVVSNEGGKVQRKVITSMKAVQVPPDHSDVLRALRLDCELTGDIIRERRNPPPDPNAGGEGASDGEQIQLPKLPDSQFLQLVQIINHNTNNTIIQQTDGQASSS